MSAGFPSIEPVSPVSVQLAATLAGAFLLVLWYVLQVSLQEAEHGLVLRERQLAALVALQQRNGDGAAVTDFDLIAVRGLFPADEVAWTRYGDASFLTFVADDLDPRRGFAAPPAGR